MKNIANHAIKKPISYSLVDLQKIDFISGSIPGEIFYGSRIIQLVENIAQQVAQKHSNSKVLGQTIDFVRFFSSFKKEDLLYCFASVNRVFGSEIEVGIKVIKEDFRMLVKKRIMSCYFTFLSIDEEDNLILVPDVLIETKQQKIRYSQALSRKKARRYNNSNIRPRSIRSRSIRL